jgi:hypothetical protein
MHIIRESGKPVVVLLDVFDCLCSFLRKKKLDISSRQECTEADSVICCCSDRQMYKSQNCRMPLFRHWQFFSFVDRRTIRTIYMCTAHVYSAYVQHILLFRHLEFLNSLFLLYSHSLSYSLIR